jgi:hypothetical protein
MPVPKHSLTLEVDCGPAGARPLSWLPPQWQPRPALASRYLGSQCQWQVRKCKLCNDQLTLKAIRRPAPRRRRVGECGSASLFCHLAATSGGLGTSGTGRARARGHCHWSLWGRPACTSTPAGGGRGLGPRGRRPPGPTRSAGVGATTKQARCHLPLPSELVTTHRGCRTQWQDPRVCSAAFRSAPAAGPAALECAGGVQGGRGRCWCCRAWERRGPSRSAMPLLWLASLGTPLRHAHST